MVKTENCPYAYREKRRRGLWCSLVEGSSNYCAHQYYCPNTRRWEAAKTAGECLLRKEGKHGADHANRN